MITMKSWFKSVWGRITETLPPPEFSSEKPPDWLVTIRMVLRPSGIVYSFRVALWSHKTSVTGQRWRFLLPFIRSPIPSFGEFSEDTSIALLGLAEKAFKEPPPVQSIKVKDGMLCNVRLFHRAPFGVIKQVWNLAGWRYIDEDESSKDLPTLVQFVEKIWRTSPC